MQQLECSAFKTEGTGYLLVPPWNAQGERTRYAMRSDSAPYMSPR